MNWQADFGSNTYLHLYMYLNICISLNFFVYLYLYLIIYSAEYLIRAFDILDHKQKMQAQFSGVGEGICVFWSLLDIKQTS